MKSKLARSLAQAVEQSGLQSGMHISFHHHLQEGDQTLNLVLEEVAEQGIRNITLHASALCDVHLPLLEHIRSGVVTGLELCHVSPGMGRALSCGVLEQPVRFLTWGGRAAALQAGRSHIDVAFLAVPTADHMGNCTGKVGKSACGALGHAMVDAAHAGKVVVLTDHLVQYPLADFSLSEQQMDLVVEVEQLTEQPLPVPAQQPAQDPAGHVLAQLAIRAIQHSDVFREGLSLLVGQRTGPQQVAALLADVMHQEGIQGSFAMGMISGALVELLQTGCFRALMDLQCMDAEAVRSLRENPAHREISTALGLAPSPRSALVDSLDVAVLGAVQIDRDFNVNMHTDASGLITGGSGEHTDAAAGARLTVVVAPLYRGRLPTVVDRVDCISTPGRDVDLLVTQWGTAVNPARQELREQLQAAGLPVVEIGALQDRADRVCGAPRRPQLEDRVIAEVYGRDGALQDQIRLVRGL